MSQFRRYEHLERFGHPEVRDLDVGFVHVFPKLDGTNASIWFGDGEVQCGSRNRTLSAEHDNHGFHVWLHSDDKRAATLRDLIALNPNLTLYGEWLVPHTLKSYRKDAWRRFWIFDVFDQSADKFLHYDAYGTAYEALGLDVVHPLCTAQNPSEEQFQQMLYRNTFLVQDGMGWGEGIVVKNYAWENANGRQVWAKLVRNEFKEKNGIEFGVSHVAGERDVCAEIVDELATTALIRKEWAKVCHAVADDSGDGSCRDEAGEVRDEFIQANRGKLIPRFLGTIFHTFVQEEAWTIVKRWKNPTVDYNRLNRLLTIRSKAELSEVFG